MMTKADAKLYRGEQAQALQLDRTLRNNRCMPTAEDAAILRYFDSAIYSAAFDRHGAWAAWDVAANWNRNLNA